MQILNIADLDRELNQLKARLISPEAKQWLATVPKIYLRSNCISQIDFQENYALYNNEGTRRDDLDGVPDTLPNWVEEQLSQGVPIYVFDPIQTGRRQFWKQLECVVNWFNSRPRPEIDWNMLTHADALSRAQQFYQQNGLSWPVNIPPAIPPAPILIPDNALSLIHI